MNVWVKFLNVHHPFFNWISLVLPFPHLNQAVTTVQHHVTVQILVTKYNETK